MSKARKKYGTILGKRTTFSIKVSSLMTFLFIILLLLNGTLTPSASATNRDWKEGDILTYKMSWDYKDELIDKSGKITTKTQMNNKGELKINISNVDDEKETYNVTYLVFYDVEQMKMEDSNSFNATVIGKRLASSFFNAFRVVLDDNNRPRLITYTYFVYLSSSLTFGSGIPYLVEPDWSAVKESFLDVWDETRSISPELGGLYTLRDLLQDAKSFKLMGKTSLKEARNSLTDNTHKWTAEFDYSGNIEVYWEDYDYRSGKYQQKFQVIDTFVMKIEIEYTSGGTLKRIFTSLETEIVSIDNVTRKAVSTTEISLDQGGLLPEGKVKFSSTFFLFGLGTLVISTLLVRKKTKIRYQAK